MLRTALRAAATRHPNDQGDLWLIDRPQVNDLHPTMKPVELIERALLNSSKGGDCVLDLFGGSGLHDSDDAVADL